MANQDTQSKKESVASISEEKSPGEINITEVKITKYKLFVGFEVNYPEAFKDGVMDIIIDPGHAFFYVTKLDAVELFFSFGPLNPPRDDQDPTEQRPSTISHPILEMANIFKLPITDDQVMKIKLEIDAISKKISHGGEAYWVKTNNTCAAKAKEILDNSDVKTPPGSGPISASGNGWMERALSAAKAEFVNPYKWHSEFKDQYGEQKKCYGPGGHGNLIEGKVFELEKAWTLQNGEQSPALI